MEIIACVAIGVAVLAITITFYALARISKLEEAEHKDVLRLLDMMKQQCTVNKQRQAIDEVTRLRLDQVTETVLAAAAEVEKLKEGKK